MMTNFLPTFLSLLLVFHIILLPGDATATDADTSTTHSRGVPALGLDNFETTLKSNLWTCVLFYDGADERKYKDHVEMMNRLSELFHGEDEDDGSRGDHRVGFAMLDIRIHPYYRAQYKFEDDPEPFIHDFYVEFPPYHSAHDFSYRISHRSFMNLRGNLYWPSRFALFASDLNVYGEVDLDFQADFEAQIAILQNWITPTIQKHPSRMEILLPSQLHQEQQAAEESESADNTFAFEEYLALKKKIQKQNERKNKNTTKFLLESGTVGTNHPHKDDGYYSYQPYDINQHWQHGDSSEDWLQSLGECIDKYLIWVEGYETQWTAERKQIEDEQTNFGVYLQEMNQQLHDLIQNVFDNDKYAPPERRSDESTFRKQRDPDKREAMKARRYEIPYELKGYLEVLVFGPGRTPTSLQRYLQEDVRDVLGATPAQRRQQARTITNSSQFVFFREMKQYMKLVEKIARRNDRYLNTLADLSTRWHNILVEFYDNLNQYYVEYLTNNPLPEPIQFERQSIPIIDMEDPANRELLSDYDAFNQQYTIPAIPVILGNVNTTNEKYTLDYLVEQCGSMDVTDRVRVSFPVGEKSSNAWGGLHSYELDRELMTKSRIDIEVVDGEEYEVLDRTLTLQQFVVLSQQLDNLYLHDKSLPGECDRILHETTLYGKEQKFRIPTVVAAYDIFNRVTLYNYARSWPSLFIGKKGSNSKVHVDSGGSAFFMYLVSGRKRWIVYHPSERPFLYDRLHGHSFVPDVLGIDKSPEANEHLSQRFPLLHRIQDAYEIIQEPGQLIYIPPSAPHAVENLDDIVGIALNMGPREGLANHLHDQIHAEHKYGFTELALKYWLFADNAQQAMPTEDPLYMTFAEYKAQY